MDNTTNASKFQIFFDFVELPTSAVTFIPMFIGFLWTYYHYGTLNWGNALLFFIPAMIFDMTVTAINTVMDYKKAIDIDFKEKDNPIGKYHLDYRKMVLFVRIALLVAIAFSLILVWRTDAMLLFIGGFAFLTGICYTYGPVPISRTPFGEIASGIVQGIGVLFFSVYVTRYESLLSSTWNSNGMVQIHIGWGEIFQIILLALPMFALTANIMLANNTRDSDQDIVNERYTLVYYIGRPNAIFFYQLLSLVPWISWALYIILGWIPWWSVITFILIIPHFKMIKRYTQGTKAHQPEAFNESVKSFMLFAIGYLITLLLAVIF